MKSIPMDKATAKSIYAAAPQSLKEELENNFGKAFFSENIMDRINSYEAACEDQGLDPVEEMPWKNPKNNKQIADNAFHKLQVIALSLREGVIMDYTSRTQKKWFPLHYEYTPGAGFRFYVSCFDWSRTDAFGGARLVVDTKEKSDYFGTKFLDIWNEFHNPIN